MNGSVPRMREPLSFELAHAKWPDDGFGWFLSRMRPQHALSSEIPAFRLVLSTGLSRPWLRA